MKRNTLSGFSEDNVLKSWDMPSIPCLKNIDIETEAIAMKANVYSCEPQFRNQQLQEYYQMLESGFFAFDRFCRITEATFCLREQILFGKERYGEDYALPGCYPY